MTKYKTKRKASTLKETISFTTFRLDSLKAEFEKTSERLVWQLTKGGGLHNIHLLHTIRDLDSLYRDIGTHMSVLRSLKVSLY